MLLSDIEYSSVCYTVNPCFLPVLYIIVCIFNSILQIYLSPPSFSLLVTLRLFSMSVTLFVLYIDSFFFLDST